jgi:hypothetical protein
MQKNVILVEKQIILAAVRVKERRGALTAEYKANQSLVMSLYLLLSSLGSSLVLHPLVFPPNYKSVPYIAEKKKE